MCGIIGIVGDLKVSNPKELGQLTSHRGPDNLGIQQFEGALLIHNRLSIIDLSEEANQPMSTIDNRYTIIFNGEIYNFQKICLELKQLGHSFKTHSDTEALLLGYIQWGKAVLDKLDGMFSFAIWDNAEKKLFCARDHIGIKPFFYSHQGNSFAFSSELKVLEKLFPNLTLCRDAIAEYIIYNYIPAPKTAYENIFKLLPGHYIEYDRKNNTTKIGTWWTVPKSNYMDASYEDATKLVRQKVGAAIRSQLIADVPVGAFLSGGIDSSIIAAEMAQTINNAKVFSIKYADNDEYDETRYAKIIADKFGLDHHIITPDFKNTPIMDTVDLILSHLDEPYGNPTVAMTHQLCNDVRKDVVVALIGDGADELFGGYPRYRALNLVGKTKPFMAIAGTPLLALLNQFPETPQGAHTLRRLKKFIRSQKKTMGSMFQDWTSIFPVDRYSEVASDLSYKYLQTARVDYLKQLYEEAGSASVANACYTDQKSFLPCNLLDGADRLSMAASFELRVPFVSRDLLEFSAQLRPEWKIKGATTKRILKEAYRDVLPEEIINRPKRGFNPPVWHWLQDNKATVTEILNPGSQVAALFQENYLAQLISRFYSKKEDSSSHIWSLIVLERWLTVRNLKI